MTSQRPEAREVSDVPQVPAPKCKHERPQLTFVFFRVMLTISTAPSLPAASTIQVHVH